MEKEEQAKKKEERARFKRIVVVSGIVIVGVAGFTLVYVFAQDALGQHDLDQNLTNGLFFAFLTLALFLIAIPVVIRLHWEDVVNKSEFTAEDWASRLRALVTASLTIILLVFILTWFATPGRLEIQVTTTTGTGANATTNTTVQLHPFVKIFVDAFVVVIAFYFPTAAAQSIAKTLKGEPPKTKPDAGGGSKDKGAKNGPVAAAVAQPDGQALTPPPVTPL